MNKKDVVARLKAFGLNKAQAEGAMQVLGTLVAEGLSKGEKVVLDGIGSFQVKQRAARVGRNPRTGEAIDVPARRAVAFKASSRLLERMGG